MKLRDWQRDCIRTALKHYCTQTNFLCQATPGAGKTTMAAELAKRLLNQRRIDFVICFGPSTAVVDGLGTSFAKRLNRTFDGMLGAAGGAYTYQSLRFLGDRFWELFDRYRVFVVFDEMHHCAGSDLHNANAWGRKILERIQNQAEYTLSLSGTPWRSDCSPVALSAYCPEANTIRCNYTYGLAKAIEDDVCRIPQITIIDNERLMVNQEDESEEYGSISALLANSSARYENLLQNGDAIRHCLKLGCNQLRTLREGAPSAAGLVVATSIAHAKRIRQILKQEFNQSVVLVTHKEKDARKTICNFRKGKEQWIVSVGMISEGTDIPRLQICCHLSRITTELYFRQVLGRVLRTTNDSPNHAWLFTLAEPQLVTFAERVDQELPEYEVLQHKETTRSIISGENTDPTWLDATKTSINNVIWDDVSASQADSFADFVDIQSNSGLMEDCQLKFMGAFKQNLVRLFQEDRALS